MITTATLKTKPGVFKNLTGVSIREFDKLHEEIAPVWAAGERKRLSRPDRQRAIGGGRNYSIDLQAQLLMTLVWLRLSLTTEAVGFFFGVDKSTASRNTRRLFTTLEQLGETRSSWPEPPKRGQAKNIEQALQAYPDLLAFVNGAEQTGPSPDNSEPQPTSASGPSLDQTRRSPDRIQLIAQAPPFQGLSPSELRAVSQAAHLRHVARQGFFFHQGDPATVFYILVKGQIRLTEVTPDGHQVLVRFISAGDPIGVIAALENTVYPLSAQAMQNCRALAWDGTALEQLMERYPQIAMNGMRLISQRWHELEERYRELATERVEQRVAQALLRLVRQVGRKVEGGILIDLPLTRQDLAEMIGTTLYTVSRILSRWEQEKLVETGRGRVLIRYPHGLARIAEDLPPEDPC